MIQTQIKELFYWQNVKTQNTGLDPTITPTLIDRSLTTQKTSDTTKLKLLFFDDVKRFV